MEKPILFSAEMINAILEGRKTQTRRVIKPLADRQIAGGWLNASRPFLDIASQWWMHESGLPLGPFKCPYQADRLWVKETWWGFGRFEKTGNLTPSRKPETSFVWDEDIESLIYFSDHPNKPRQQHVRNDWHKRPSIFMPRWASRLTLNVNSIRIEQVQDISYADIKAEGCWDYLALVNDPPHRLETISKLTYKTFSELWDSINAKRGYGWDFNPWVWVVEFELTN